MLNRRRFLLATLGVAGGAGAAGEATSSLSNIAGDGNTSVTQAIKVTKLSTSDGNSAASINQLSSDNTRFQIATSLKAGESTQITLTLQNQANKTIPCRMMVHDEAAVQSSVQLSPINPFQLTQTDQNTYIFELAGQQTTDVVLNLIAPNNIANKRFNIPISINPITANATQKVTITDSFSTGQSDELSLVQDAEIDTTREVLRLTPEELDKAGIAWLETQLEPPIRAEFGYQITGSKLGSADGIVFMFNKQRKINGEDFSPELGRSIGFTSESGNDVDGYGVELDTFNNRFDPSDEHIGIIENNARKHLETTNADVTTQSENRVEINITNDTAIIKLNGTVELRHTRSNSFQTGFYNVGFSAATGMEADKHLITDFNITGKRHID